MSCDKFFFIFNWYCIIFSVPFVMKRTNPLSSFLTTCHYPKNFGAEVIKWFDDHEVKIQYLFDKDKKIRNGQVQNRLILLGSLKGIIFIRTFLLVSIKGLRLKVFLVYSLFVV